VLRSLFSRHRDDLAAHALGGVELEEGSFVGLYPALESQLDLLLAVKAPLAAAPRGLDVVGVALSDPALGDAEVGRLLALEAVFEVLQGSLDVEVRATVARLDALPEADQPPQARRVARIVAVLERAQHRTPTTAELIRRSLYTTVGGGDPCPGLPRTLAWLEDSGFLARTTTHGYRIRTAAEEEWELSRHGHQITEQKTSDRVRDTLRRLLLPLATGRPDEAEIPWNALYADGKIAHDVRLLRESPEGALIVNLLHLPLSRRSPTDWKDRSTWARLRRRLHWVAGGDLSVVRERLLAIAKKRGNLVKDLRLAAARWQSAPRAAC
jgi:hypothetical protein